MDIKIAYQKASEQRFISLQNAFKTIHCFAEPSLNPEEFEQFENLERVLLERYEKDAKTNNS